MTKRLVLIHGRAQQNQDSLAMKAEWVQLFQNGLQGAGLTMPIAETDIVSVIVALRTGKGP